MDQEGPLAFVGCLLALPALALVLWLRPPGALIAAGFVLGVSVGLVLSLLYYRLVNEGHSGTGSHASSANMYLVPPRYS